jgi:alcohol dehydrogenase
MPSGLTAATGMDALTHAIEAYVSTASSPVTDLHALEAMRLIIGSLETAVLHPEHGEARSNMMLGSLFAGLAFSNASLGIVHAMAHSLGGLLDLPHGECNAILLEQSIRLNFDAAPERYRRIATAFGIKVETISKGDELKNKLIDALVNFRHKVGLNFRLRDLGLRQEVFSVLAEHALGDPCLVTNPKRATIDEIWDCYEKAF